jgi:hypothetical protein
MPSNPIATILTRFKNKNPLQILPTFNNATNDFSLLFPLFLLLPKVINSGGSGSLPQPLQGSVLNFAAAILNSGRYCGRNCT